MESEISASQAGSPSHPSEGTHVTDNVSTSGGNFIGRDQKIQGDLVHGDKVMGHKIIQEAPKPRVPLQRPPRAEHFVDRKADLDKLLADLQAGQVVTLCGSGGIGKTALAAEAVWQIAPGDTPSERFPDGILFHSFYNQPQAALALEHIALSFGEQPRPTPATAAQRALAGRRALLLLDGAEGADDLQIILAVRDQCGVLVTSRRHEDALGDWQDVSPLPPDEAVSLLQAWGKGHVADIAIAQRICALVGYLPLAVRLIGSYLSTRDRDAGDYLQWLEQTPLAILEHRKRQQDSVPLLLERSLAQVSNTARQIMGIVGLLALAPFDWAAIAAALDLTPLVERALDELVNYSLLLRREQAYQVTHALIHTYARLHLAPSSAVIHRLVTHYITFVKDHGSDFGLLKSVHSHIMTLLRVCQDHHAWQAAHDLAWAIDDYLDLQGYWTDRLLALEIGLAAAGALPDRRLEGAWLGRLGVAYRNLGQVEQAIAYHQQALTIAREVGDREAEGNHLGNLSLAYVDLQQAEQVIAHAQQALTIAQEIGDRRGEGQRLGYLGLAYWILEQIEQAIAYHQQALTISREVSDRRSEGNRLGNLGIAYNALGQVEQAIAYHQQALIIAQEIGDRRGQSRHLRNLGIAYDALGQVEQAIEYYQQALTIAQEIGDRLGEGRDLGNLGIAYRNLGQVEQAIAYHQQALTIAREVGDREAEGNHLGNLSLAYVDLQQVEQAIALYEQALMIAREIGDRESEGAWLTNLGIAYRDLGQLEQARQIWPLALHIFEEIKSPNAEKVHEWLASLPSP